ncbi:Uncharacterised protein [uncultured Roseburia sp.]|uniref:Uncharacterized protein n=1 Tax=Brotonthovivens ammoniilytica TaxID=2981725 RepID=A0ABT2TNJ7_9FIRM|nr:hypothetical protein [Brotonthovivens ammoniilytica]MCU6763777.1 hypothetical protein [Brotonthovivens ammoniilytica]SCJ34643.1 Uncharacterised protein [uncultured Roseburia sp.]
MHTVIIANEKMTQLFRDYKNLYIPFLEDGEISFCDWNEEGPDLDTALPDLSKAVDGDHNWRAIILHDPGHFEDADGNEIFDEYNPYDYACNYGREVPLVEDSPIPLIRLTHHLAGYPDLGVYDIVEKPVEERDQRDVVEYETMDYSKELQKKHAVLKEKYNELLWKPKDLWIISIRRRRRKLNKKDLKEIWTSKLETESSRFWLRNNYPEVCRFMCFDVSDIYNELYCKELFQFWMTVLTLARNKIPASNIQAYRLYRITCEFDKEKMREEFMHHYSRICQAKETVESALKILPEQNIDPDEEILQLQPVPVIFENHDEKSAYIETREIGFAKDCPQREDELWKNEYKDIKKYLANYVKEPRRAIDRAAEYTRKAEDSFYDLEYELDQIQLEELQESVYQLEEDIMSAETMRIVDLNAYEEEMQSVNKNVEEVIEGRMTRKVTVIAGLSAAILFFCGFLPYLIHAASDGIPTFLKSLQLAVISAACLAAVGFLVLFVFRSRVKKAIHSFNLLTSRIVAGINRAASTFEEYLSLICTYMKAQSVIQGTKDNSDSVKSHRALLRMHKYAMNETLEQMAMWCAAYDLKIKREPISASEEYYDFDMMPTECPIYYMKTNPVEQNISINGSGDILTAPYEFVTKLHIVREEIYERGGEEA